MIHSLQPRAPSMQPRVITVADVQAAARRCAGNVAFQPNWHRTLHGDGDVSDYWSYFCHHGKECENYRTLHESLAFFEARAEPQSPDLLGLPVETVEAQPISPDCTCNPGESVIDAMMRVLVVEAVKPSETTSEAGNSQVTQCGIEVELSHESLVVDVTLADADCELSWVEAIGGQRVRIHAKLKGTTYEADRTLETYGLESEVVS